MTNSTWSTLSGEYLVIFLVTVSTSTWLLLTLHHTENTSEIIIFFLTLPTSVATIGLVHITRDMFSRQCHALAELNLAETVDIYITSVLLTQSEFSANAAVIKIAVVY